MFSVVLSAITGLLLLLLPLLSGSGFFWEAKEADAPRDVLTSILSIKLWKNFQIYNFLHNCLSLLNLATVLFNSSPAVLLLEAWENVIGCQTGRSSRWNQWNPEALQQLLQPPNGTLRYCKEREAGLGRDVTPPLLQPAANQERLLPECLAARQQPVCCSGFSLCTSCTSSSLSCDQQSWS